MPVHRTPDSEPQTHEKTRRSYSRLIFSFILIVFFSHLSTIVGKVIAKPSPTYERQAAVFKDGTIEPDSEEDKTEQKEIIGAQQEKMTQKITGNFMTNERVMSTGNPFRNWIFRNFTPNKKPEQSAESFPLGVYSEDIFRYNIGAASFDNRSYFDNSSCNENITGNYNNLEEKLTDVIIIGITAVFLGTLILITVFGNVFVIAAILLERSLQCVANYLIVSLAVADLMVACLVMPLGAIYEINQGWILGPELCDIWTSSDVLCCTASILHLVAIAVDRYWAVTNIDYIHNRNGCRIVIMIIMVWSAAFVVSLAPQFGWKDPDYLNRINLQQRCLVSQDVGYQIFATFTTFYIPLFVILVLYWKIFQTARKRIHRRRAQRNVMFEICKDNSNENINKNKTLDFLSKSKFLRLKKPKESQSQSEGITSSLVLVEGQSTCSTIDVIDDNEISRGEINVENIPQATTAFTISNDTPTPHLSPEKSSGTTATTNNESTSHQYENKLPVTAAKLASTPNSPCLKPPTILQKKRDIKKESLDAKREKKAAKTLAIITGAFVVCWLPFFIMALLMPLCESCYIDDYMASFFLWLGYFNSTLNPIIYTVFSPEFRQAFKRILCGVNRSRQRGRAVM